MDRILFLLQKALGSEKKDLKYVWMCTILHQQNLKPGVERQNVTKNIFEVL
jgi:hypothetical protein